MKSQCYAIFDSCSGIYEKPFFSTTDDLVKREFQDVVNAADHPISNHPEHYSLWRLGNFDNTTGKINDEANECLWTGIEAKAQSQTVDKQKMLDLNGSIPVRQADSPEDAHAFVDPHDMKPGGTA